MGLAIQTTRLQEIATEVNSKHASIESSLRRSLRTAIEAGDLLNEARQLVAHGEWLNWLGANFSGSHRTAQKYMQLAQAKPQLEAQGGIENKGIQKALQLLAQPEMSGQPLTDEQRRRFAELRAKLNAAAADPDFWLCCASLMDVREHRLYRCEAPTFETWVAQTMEVDIEKARQLIEMTDYLFAVLNLNYQEILAEAAA